MKRKVRSILIGVLATALVVIAVPTAMALTPVGPLPPIVIGSRVSIPHVAKAVVTVGVPFDATGSVVPTIAANDTSTVVVLQVLKGGVSAMASTATVTMPRLDRHSSTMPSTSAAGRTTTARSSGPGMSVTDA